MRQRLILLIAVTTMAALGPLAALALAAGSGGAGLGVVASTACVSATTPTTASTQLPAVTTAVTTPAVTTPAVTTPAVTTPTTATDCATSTAGPVTTVRTPTITAPVPTFTATTPPVTVSKTTVTKTTPAGKTTSTTTTKTTAYPYSPPTNTAPAPAVIPVPKSNPFTGRGMWIWMLGDSDHGNVASLIATAKSYGISTLLIKSGDGSGYWNQFSPKLVDELHAAGLNVCAWQYVYGSSPVAEAEVGARAVKNGADCLVIDAEAQYQGKYVQAQTYIDTLRKLIGDSFPVGLAGFPYVSYHLSFPYSVFLGPNGAQYNVPQMYWQDIGVSPATVYAVTYEYNEIYQRPIFPLGQLYDNPPTASIAQFGKLATTYGATGLSWWDLQSSSPAQVDATTITGALPKGFVAQRTAATILPKSSGDLVLWAQEHLYSAGYKISIDGSYGAQTRNAVTQFQKRAGLPASGTITGATWNALLRYKPTTVRWATRKHGQVPTVVTPSSTITVTVPATSSGSNRSVGSSGSATKTTVTKTTVGATIPAPGATTPSTKTFAGGGSGL